MYYELYYRGIHLQHLIIEIPIWQSTESTQYFLPEGFFEPIFLHCCARRQPFIRVIHIYRSSYSTVRTFIATVSNSGHF